MSGEVKITKANVAQEYAKLQNNGVLAPEVKEKQILEFKNKYATELKEAGVDLESDPAKDRNNLWGFTKTGTIPTAADEAAAEEKAGQTTGQDIKKLSPIERKALGAIQSEFQHGDDVVALENGKVVVKSKTTGEVNTKKTEQAQKAYDEWHLDVDGTPVDTTITKDSVNPHAKVGLVDKDDAKKMREYDTTQKAHNEFTNESITKQDIKNAKQAVKDAKKEAKALQKQAKAARKAGDYEKADQLEEKAAELNGNLAEKQNDYEKKKALGSTKGERGIAKAAKHNAKRYDKIDNVGKVLLPGQEDVASAVDGKESGKTVTLSKGQAETLSRLHGYSKYMLGKFEKDLEKAKATGDEASIKSAEEALDAAKTKYGDLATCMEDGKVNVEKLQTGLAQFSGGDYKFNLDEKKALGAESGVKKGDIASLAKAVGFGNESKMKGKLAAGGVAAAATALGSLIGTHKHSATATARDEKTATSPDAFDEQTAREWFKFMDSNGNPVYKEISVTAKAHAKGVTATAVAEAVAKASSKVPILGQLAGPALAGVTAFFMANPQTEDAFNGNKVETVLKNLSTVSGADNKKIVAQIQDMKITGDPQRDKVIKAAVIEASINGKANTEELLAAYESLKDTKKAIEEIDNYKEPTVSTTPPPAPPAPPTPEPCTDIEDRYSHGAVIPSREVRGHGQSPYWIAKAYIGADGQELTPAQRRAVQKALAKTENKQVSENGNFNGSKIGYRYKKEIILPDGTTVKLADDAAKRIGTGKMTKTRVRVVNGRQVHEQREVDCETRKPVAGDAGQWHEVKE